MKQLIFPCLLYAAFAACTSCSTANNWRPPVPTQPVHTVQICVQMGSKLYDHVTGKECLTEAQRRRAERARCKTPVECARK